MNISLDVSGYAWDRVDFDHCTLFVQMPRVLPLALSLDLWGVILHTVGHEGLLTSPLDLPLNFDTSLHNIFIGGNSILRFEDTTRVGMEITLYNPTDLRDFWHDSQGQAIRLTRTWGQSRVVNGTKYDLGGFLAWPPGDCELSIAATGAVSFEFMTEDCLPADDEERWCEKVRPPWAPTVPSES